MCLFTVWNITGVAYTASAVMEPKSAQLSVVIYTLITVLFSGLDPRLSEMDHSYVGMLLLSMGQNRWMQESLYTQHTVKLEPGWKMLPSFYQNKGSDSALGGLIAFRYTEEVGFGFNNLVQIVLGLFWRVIAYFCLCYCNRNKMGMKTPMQELQIFMYQYVPIEKQDLSDFSETTKSVFSFIGSQCSQWCRFLCVFIATIYNIVTDSAVKRKNLRRGGSVRHAKNNDNVELSSILKTSSESKV